MIIATAYTGGVITAEGTQRNAPQTMVITSNSFATASMPAFQIKTEEMALRGPRGADGAGSSTFVFTQNTALAVWTIPHNLSRYPGVIVVDSTGAVVQTGVSYVDANIIQVIADVPFAGKAYLN